MSALHVVGRDCDERPLPELRGKSGSTLDGQGDGTATRWDPEA